MNKFISVFFLILLIVLYLLFKPYSFSEINQNIEFNTPILESTTLEPFFKDGCKITPKKNINFNTRILSITKYENIIDSFIVPYDIVFGWNNMVKNEYLNQINISQHHRWFFYNYKHNQLFSEKDIIANFDNFHVIPFSDYITFKLKDISKGDIVNIKGYLVDLDCTMLPFTRNSSLSFTDRSATSCEQILIEEINSLE